MTPEPNEAARFIERWHDFYMLAGTASATLVGLLFVSLSFNLDILLHDRYAHVLAYARNTLFSFIAVLLYSLFFLVPNWYGRPLGMQIAIGSMVFVAIALYNIRSADRKTHDPARAGAQRRRTIWTLVSYAGLGAAGLLVVFTRQQQWFYVMIGFICLLLGNAVGSAWDLLVEVGKLKIRERAEEREP